MPTPTFPTPPTPPPGTNVDGGTSGGGSGTTDHRALSNRNTPNQHTPAAIPVAAADGWLTGLSDLSGVLARLADHVPQAGDRGFAAGWQEWLVNVTVQYPLEWMYDFHNDPFIYTMFTPPNALDGMLVLLVNQTDPDDDGIWRAPTDSHLHPLEHIKPFTLAGDGGTRVTDLDAFGQQAGAQTYIVATADGINMSLLPAGSNKLRNVTCVYDVPIDLEDPDWPGVGNPAAVIGFPTLVLLTAQTDPNQNGLWYVGAGAGQITPGFVPGVVAQPGGGGWGGLTYRALTPVNLDFEEAAYTEWLYKPATTWERQLAAPTDETLAALLNYTPGDGGNWPDPDPGTLPSATDLLASRVHALEGFDIASVKQATDTWLLPGSGRYLGHANYLFEGLPETGPFNAYDAYGTEVTPLPWNDGDRVLCIFDGGDPDWPAGIYTWDADAEALVLQRRCELYDWATVGFGSGSSWDVMADGHQVWQQPGWGASMRPAGGMGPTTSAYPSPVDYALDWTAESANPYEAMTLVDPIDGQTLVAGKFVLVWNAHVLGDSKWNGLWLVGAEGDPWTRVGNPYSNIYNGSSGLRRHLYVRSGKYAGCVFAKTPANDAINAYEMIVGRYTPTNGGDWTDATPVHVFAALDELAARVAALEA